MRTTVNPGALVALFTYWRDVFAGRLGGRWYVDVYPHDVLAAWCVTVRCGARELTLLVDPVQDTAAPVACSTVTVGWSVTESTTVGAFLRRCARMGCRNV